MAEYLLIESKSPWESCSTAELYALARGLAEAGHEVTLYLVQNGVLAARRAARDLGLDQTAGRLRVLADDFSLRERAIPEGDLRASVSSGGIETVVDLLARCARAVWH